MKHLDVAFRVKQLDLCAACPSTQFATQFTCFTSTKEQLLTNLSSVGLIFVSSISALVVLSNLCLRSHMNTSSLSSVLFVLDEADPACERPDDGSP